LTSVSENSHTLGLNLLSDVFRWHGWEVFPMFSELPDNEIVDAAQRHQVDMVCLSASLPGQIVKAMKAINALRQSGWKGIISVGGAAFVHSPETFKSTGADILGVDTESTVEQATKLMSERTSN
jgi:methanogenic corrinoid protein MtbC1